MLPKNCLNVFNLLMADVKSNGAHSGEPPPAPADLGPPKKPKRNKYALACSLLASMTSILLGYGENYYYYYHI